MSVFDNLAPDDLVHHSTHTVALHPVNVNDVTIHERVKPFVNQLLTTIAASPREGDIVAYAILGTTTPDDTGLPTDYALLYRSMEDENVQRFNARLAREASFHKSTWCFWAIQTLVGTGSKGSDNFDIKPEDLDGNGVFWFFETLEALDGETFLSGMVRYDQDGEQPLFVEQAMGSKLPLSPLVTTILHLPNPDDA